MKTVRLKTLQEQKREYPGDKLMSLTETVTPTNCMDSQINLRRFTNLQVSLLQLLTVICSWGPTK